MRNRRSPGDDYSGTALGFVAGLGYEGWVGEQWSVGGLARVSYISGTMSAVNEKQRPDVKVSALVPERS